MSKVLFVSDLHLGHKKIITYGNKPGAAPRGTAITVAGHDAWVIRQCLMAKPDKRTLWYLMGDLAMEKSCLPLLDKLPGRKIMIAGNHDNFPTEDYLKHVDVVRGSLKAYGMWISHIPMAPEDLFDAPCIHGHQHYYPLRGNPQYFNACIEWLPQNIPVSLDWLRKNWLR